MNANFPSQDSPAAGKKLLLATGNAHKAAEIRAILDAQGAEDWQLLTLADYPHYQPPEEDGDSFSANAALKALAAARFSGLPTLADDSGLEVAALDNAPGIYSARYAGPQHNDADNRAKLLTALDGLPPERRSARFVCHLCLALPQADGSCRCWTTRGECAGRIAEAEQGQHGFGYDNLFFLPQLGQTMAQLDPARKNQLSHRYQAMLRAAQLLAGCGGDLQALAADWPVICDC